MVSDWRATLPPYDPLPGLTAAIARIPHWIYCGSVVGLAGNLVEAIGLDLFVSIGERCEIISRSGARIPAEVVGFRSGLVLLVPYGTLEGVGTGCAVEAGWGAVALFPDVSWLGRVVNAFGQPIDDGPPLRRGANVCPVRRRPPSPHRRDRIGAKLDVGVRAVNGFLTCCQGQRFGIFAGSGVGKSTLLSMIARHTQADVNVIGLIGERGREAREFIEDNLGVEGMQRSVVIVATSDEPAPTRRLAALSMMTIAEYFRDLGAQVLCMMDSVTRFAMAQREIGLAAGEPPASKGYTPSVFAELPQLLERAGPGEGGKGSITGLFTVLVEGDDHNEPIADAVRSILDGHIVLDRAIAERGRFPAIDVLRSVSRMMPDCNTDAENAVVVRARRVLTVYENMAELIRLGAYRRGSDPEVDQAIRLYPKLENFLRQAKNERTPFAEVYALLERALDADDPAAAAVGVAA
jgi:flagellum-specific ATP synthase